MNHSQHHQYSHIPQPSSADDEIESTTGSDQHHDDNNESFSSTLRPTDDASLSSSSSSHHYIPTQAQKSRAVGLFALTVILLFADQNLMAPNLTAMARDFGFTDTQRDVKLGGNIALAFFVLGAPASYLVGVLADSNRVKRVQLFALVVGLGEGACGLTFITTTYWQLYVCRAITGFSLGGALPLIYSILGDLYPADQRHLVSSLVGIGAGIGIALGQGVAGYLGPTWGWRLPFLIVSIPALLCAAMVWLTVEEPERGGMEQVAMHAHEHRHEPYRQQEDTTDDPETAGIRRDYNDKDKDDHNEKDASSVPSDLQSSVEMPPYEREAQPTQAADALSPAKDTWKQQTSGCSTDETYDTSACAVGRRIEQDVFLVNESPEFHLHRSEGDDHCNALCTLVKTRTVLFSLLQGGPGCIPWGIVNTYLNDYLAEDRGMSVEFATTTLLLFGFGNFLGMLLGGAGASHLYRMDRRYPSLLAGGAAFLSCICLWILLNGIDSTSSLWWIVIVAVSTGLTSGTTGPIVKATLQNVTHPQARGQAFALLNTFDDFGRGLGPVFVAALIQSLNGNRRHAFTFGATGWMICGFVNTGMFWTVEQDQDVLQQRLLLESQVRRSRVNSRCMDDEGADVERVGLE